MCSEAGIDGKTNHSLRVTGATSLFQNSVPEKVIENVVGHRLLDALCSYENICLYQHQDATNILMNFGSTPGLAPKLVFLVRCSIQQLTVNIGKTYLFAILQLEKK